MRKAAPSLLLVLLLVTVVAGCAPAHSGPAAPTASASPAGPAWQEPKGDLADAIVLLTDPKDLEKLKDHWKPEELHKPASELFEKARVLTAPSVDGERFMAAMFGMARALDAKCTLCHEVDEKKKDFASDKKDAKKTARQMMIMTQDLDRTYFEGKTRITCATCHRKEAKGEVEPEDMKARVAKITLPPDLTLTGEKAKEPAEKVFKNLQVLNQLPAGYLGSVMAALSVSLGVECTHCHVQGNFPSDEKKEKKIAREMMGIANRADSFLQGGGDDRVITCWTCHRGEKKPDRLMED